MSSNRIDCSGKIRDFARRFVGMHRQALGSTIVDVHSMIHAEKFPGHMHVQQASTLLADELAFAYLGGDQ